VNFTLKLVNQSIYNEIKEIGLLKVEYKIVNIVTEEGKIVFDRFGNPKQKTIACKNFNIANKCKSSKSKTYFVEDRVLEDYLKIKQESK
jgi:hypothetical protein